MTIQCTSAQHSYDLEMKTEHGGTNRLTDNHKINTWPFSKLYVQFGITVLLVTVVS